MEPVSRAGFEAGLEQASYDLRPVAGCAVCWSTSSFCKLRNAAPQAPFTGNYNAQSGEIVHRAFSQQMSESVVLCVENDLPSTIFDNTGVCQ